MERKLIKQGGGGLTVYLPKKWLDRKKLKEGDAVNIKEKDSYLVVSSEVSGKKELTLKLNNKNEHDLTNILTHVYRQGFEKIKIENLNPNSEKEIKDLIKNTLLGFEFTERNNDSCVLENISEPTGEQYDSIIKRILFILNENQNLLIEDARKSKFSRFSEIKEMRNQIDRLTLFCRRVIVKEKSEMNPLISWEFLTFLMHISHTYFYAYQYANENSIKISKETLKVLEELSNYLSLYRSSFLEQNLSQIHEINKLKKEHQFKNRLTLIEKSKGKEAVFASYLREIFRLIQLGTSPILSNLIESSVSKNLEESKD